MLMRTLTHIMISDTLTPRYSDTIIYTLPVHLIAPLTLTCLQFSTMMQIMVPCHEGAVPMCLPLYCFMTTTVI